MPSPRPVRRSGEARVAMSPTPSTGEAMEGGAASPSGGTSCLDGPAARAAHRAAHLAPPDMDLPPHARTWNKMEADKRGPHVSEERERVRDLSCG
jgi:hypothetical protein